MIIHENEFFRDYDIEIKGVIEVGAHYAEEYWGMVEGGIENFIFFEPIEANYKKMVSLLPDTDNISIYPIALGNFSGSIRMFVETDHQGKSCSILKPILHLEEYPDISFNDQETVTIDRLDNVDIDLDKFNMLQTDTQGYDLEVLMGAVNTLEFMDVVKVEVHRKELYEGAATIEQIDNFLTDFERVYTYWMGSWGDAYYVRI